MSSTHRLLKASRLVHLYLGVFITPALIFFAFTGFIQTFSWHETTRGSSYKPPKILAELGQLHKKQTLVLPNRRPFPPEAPASTSSNSQQMVTPANKRDEAARPAGNAPQQDSAARRPDNNGPPTSGKKQNLLPMKLFFGFVSIGLFISTITGLYMSYKFIRNKPLITATLIAGIVVPVLLTFL